MRGTRTRSLARSNRRRELLAIRRRTVVLTLAGILGFGLGASAERLLGRLAPERAVLHGVSVAGCERVPPPELVAHAGLAAGMPLAAIDLGAIERDLAAHPWVRSSRATLLPLGRMLIDVEERVPVALVRDVAGGPHFVDASGHIFADAPLDAALPELRGLESDAAGDAPEPRLAQGARLLERFAAHGIRPAPTDVWLGGDAPERLPAVSWGEPDQGGLRAVIGGGALEEKLGYLAELLQAGLPEVAQATEIDLRFGERVILRGVPAEAATAEEEEDRASVLGARSETRGG